MIVMIRVLKSFIANWVLTIPLGGHPGISYSFSLILHS